MPSRSNIFTPRNRPIRSSTGNAPAERMVACSIAGNISLIAIWLKPQLRHNISIIATAPALSERSAEESTRSDDIYPRVRLDAVLLMKPMARFREAAFRFPKKVIPE